MSRDIRDIIRVSVVKEGTGIGYTDYGVGMIFAAQTDMVSVGIEGQIHTVKAMDLSSVVKAGTATMAIAQAWFSQSPSPREIKVIETAKDFLIDSDVAQVLSDAADQSWFFFPFFPADSLSDTSLVAAATWCSTNRRVFSYAEGDITAMTVGGSTGQAALATVSSDFVMRMSFYNSDKAIINPLVAYPHVSMLSRFAAVDYNGYQTTVTGDNVKVRSVGSLTATTTEQSYLHATHTTYQTVYSGGAVTTDVYATNVKSTSGAWLDSTIHFEVLANKVETDMFNHVKNGDKAPSLTARGYQSLINIAKLSGLPFTQDANGLLGAGYYTHPITAEQLYTDSGYVVVNKAVDIYKLSSADRQARKAYPLTIICLDAGGTQQVNINIVQKVSEAAI